MGIFHWLDTPVPDSHLMLLAAKILVEIRLPSDPEKQALTEPNGPGTSRHLVAGAQNQGDAGQGGQKKEQAQNTPQTPAHIIHQESTRLPPVPRPAHLAVPANTV